MDRLQEQMNFIMEVDKIKKIERQTYISDSSRHENDAEHSWHLALMCMVLAEHANEEIDKFKVMSMVLIHDIVEIDAGDTYAYDTEANKTQAEREQKAADRIFQLLPSDQSSYFRALWEEFEASESNEAKFAKTLDRIQPMMLNDATDGKAWKEHQVSKSQVINRNKNTALGSIELWNFIKEKVFENVEKGNLKDY